MFSIPSTFPELRKLKLSVILLSLGFEILFIVKINLNPDKFIISLSL